MLPAEYQVFQERLAAEMPQERIIDDLVLCFAYATDASVYRMQPKLVVKVHNESEVQSVLRLAQHMKLAVCFRAAGTSLSGQAQTDSILIIATQGWTGFRVEDSARSIALQPGLTGSLANAYLKSFGRKIGPDPASINAAMIGGIANNNASGMCCGITQNSYNTLKSMRIILSDGTLIDSGSEESRKRLQRTHGNLLKNLADLAQSVQRNARLSERIRKKYTLKNTTGYSLNALVDFHDPIDILIHLIIGSEGTLGFLSEITYHTVVDEAHKATAFILFPNIAEACRAVIALKKEQVTAVELMDEASLRSVAGKPGVPISHDSVQKGTCALLVEVRSEEKEDCDARVLRCEQCLRAFRSSEPIVFTRDIDVAASYWKVRKGLFPSVGAVRKSGTAVIIEDVAFPIEHLAEATLDLHDCFQRHHYYEAIIFGHALEGNLHFVFTQDFSVEAEVQRYKEFMENITNLVTQRYDGSLKAEHGTGRNMAPFVQKEWGEEAWQIMHRLKNIIDPSGILNPDVILGTDEKLHLRNLKAMPSTHKIIDTCIECGFCEPNCPSRNLSFTPRQRIAVWRELSRLETEQNDLNRLAAFRKVYEYYGKNTCATDGMCAVDCPVDINTGSFIKDLRRQQHSVRAQKMATAVQRHFAMVGVAMRNGLRLVGVVRYIFGDNAMISLSTIARKISAGTLPLWSSGMPGTAKAFPIQSEKIYDDEVVYFSACMNQVMGCSKHDKDKRSLPVAVLSLLEKAQYHVRLCSKQSSLCCGMPMESKGFASQADTMAKEVNTILRERSDNGRIPILCDTSPCTQRLREHIDEALTIYEPVEFIDRFILNRVEIDKDDEEIVLHVTCSSHKMSLSSAFERVARTCSDNVTIPKGIACCGFAGDRGFNVPELNASALETLSKQIPEGVRQAYSNSRTCEIGLSAHAGIPYQSLVYLVDRCARTRGRQN